MFRLECTEEGKHIVMKWKTKKEPEEVKSKDGVIRRNLDRILVSATTPQPSNLSRCSQESITEKFLQKFTSPLTDRLKKKKREIKCKRQKRKEKATIRMNSG